MILLPSQNMMLLYLPIISVIRCFLHKSPISFTCSISISIILSSPGCEIPIILPLFKCFLKSMQKFGAVIGLGLFSSTRYTRGREALADNSSLNCPLPVLTVKRSSSFSGWAILYRRPPLIVLLSSLQIFAITIPSSAIIILNSNFFRLLMSCTFIIKMLQYIVK